MNIAAVTANGSIVPFEPRQTHIKDAKLQAVIDYAQRVHDWPTLEAAVDLKIAEQRDFVAWWDQTVGVRLRPGGSDGGALNADLRSTVSKDDAEAQTGISQQTVSRWRKALKDEASEAKYRARLLGAAYRAAMLTDAEEEEDEDEAFNHRAQGTGENEWYTPAEYIERARTAMGAINLDPATSPLANQTVQAEQIFTSDDDGLAQEWHGNVWMNPPYSQPHIQQFIEKLVHEVRANRTQQAIALTHNYTDTAWFHHAAAHCRAICFTRGRIAFMNPQGEKASPTQGQAFFYFGDQVDAFVTAFADLGCIMVRP